MGKLAGAAFIEALRAARAKQNWQWEVAGLIWEQYTDGMER